jgi:glycosyltransferase involved in cell wall biosynthesis
MPLGIYLRIRYLNTPLIKRQRLDLLPRKLAPSKKTILFIDHKIPSPDKDSGSYRIMQILKILSSSYNLVFWPDNILGAPRHIAAMEDMGIEIVAPVSSQRFLKRYGRYFDIVILSRPKVLKKYLNLVKATCIDAKVIYDTVDLHYMRLKRQAELAENASEKIRLMRQARDYFHLETTGVIQTDQTWVVAREEQQALFAEHPHANVRVVPNIHPLPSIRKRDFDDTRDVLFIGSFDHHPNIDAMRYCAAEVWPLIIRQIPSARLIIIGPNPPPEIQELASPSVIVKGYVPDIEPELLRARVFLAPLRYGAGMKGKIGQALSYGIPTVTTAIGAEGFSFSGNELIITDNPSEMAKAVVALYTDKRIWEEYHHRGRVCMERFTPDAVQVSLHANLQCLFEQ